MNTMNEKYELAKWLAGELSETELKAFQNTPEYTTYAKIADYSSQLKAPDFDADLLYQNTINRKKTTPKVIPFFNTRWMKVAAIFVVFLGLSFFFRTNMSTTAVADNGTKTKFTLPDQSEIVLNSGSTIEYKKWNWENNRNLDLEGEAYFKVAHGKKFKVSTSLGTVTVLGTQFNVKARKDRFDVTCYKGRVKVVHDHKMVIITKGTTVSFNKAEFEKQTTSSTKPEWIENQILFKKESLPNIIDELERQYDCKIVLKTKENQQLFSGTVPSNNLKDAIAIVSSTFHLKLFKFEAKNIILEDF
jgi:ferric-dicitrate binding protein FerR (iron transport regulator)